MVRRYIPIPLQNAILHFAVFFSRWGSLRGESRIDPWVTVHKFTVCRSSKQSIPRNLPIKVSILKCERYIPIPLQNAIFAFCSVLLAMGFPKGRITIIPLGDRAQIYCVPVIKTKYTARLTHQSSHLEV